MLLRKEQIYRTFLKDISSQSYTDIGRPFSLSIEMLRWVNIFTPLAATVPTLNSCTKCLDSLA